MTDHDPWQKLTGIARRAPAADDTAPSMGFVTRVAALGMAQRAEDPDFFGVLARRALAFALLVLVSSAAASYPFFSSGSSSVSDLDDPVGEWVAGL
jgi:hypothetical protein